jgi:excisionase family DNA binding protein
MDDLGQSNEPQRIDRDVGPSSGLTISEAAARSGVAEKTVRRMIKAGTVPCVRQAIPGGFRYLLPPEAVAQIAHEVGDRVLPDGVPSPGVGMGVSQAIQDVGRQDTQSWVPHPDQRVQETQATLTELRQRLQDAQRERDEWMTLAKESQATIRALSETVNVLNETNRQLALPAHPEEPEDAVPPKRGFWDWVLGR